ncbi:ATP-binding protein [Hydrogenophaga flava]|uniref:ATP-binding protein n=1 Tax=Hydrogenophaga flava TaxID=65657 RepID=UPI000825F744|nr:ATP-binding protein [Hydrogenophaga flava]
MRANPEGRSADGLIWGLQRRLLVLLFLPLGLVGLVSVYFHYQSAGTASLQQDQQLLRLVPMLADSVVVTLPRDAPRPIDIDADPGLALLLAPPVDEFLKEREGYAGYGVMDANGRLLIGDRWLPTVLPSTEDAEFLSVVDSGITYRVVAQRSPTAAGELIIMLADGSDGRQQWLDTVLLRVVLPNLMLMLVVAVAVTWAVSRALRPLIDLKEAVERRSPRDLSPIDAESAPAEVRPLVSSLNRLFSLVNDQTQAQRRFVADAAHQLRTPLAGLQAQVEAWSQAARSMGGAEALSLRVEQVHRLRDATRRTSQLANQLLALSRADSVSASTHPMEQVDLQELCENILALYLDAAADKQMDLGLEAAPAQTRGHAWLLRELLINIVDNAVKYTPPGGRITLRCGQDLAAEPPQAWIEVEDDGPGIAEDERQRVLERFYRLPGTQADGNGLGLAIADEIARSHHTQLQLLTGGNGRGLRVRVVFEAVRAGGRPVRESSEG